VHTQNLGRVATTPPLEKAESLDWETPAGPTDPSAKVRLERAAFIYQGAGDSHWRGQPCYLGTQAGTHPGKRVVIMACGCRASVPRGHSGPCNSHLLAHHRHDAITRGHVLHWAHLYDPFATIITLGRASAMREQTADLAALRPGELEVGWGTGDVAQRARARVGPSARSVASIRVLT